MAINHSIKEHREEYIPDHPDADWSGFVARRTSRKHIPCKPDQLAAIEGNGLCPGNNVPTDEWKKPARKIVGHRESGADSEVGAESQSRSSTFSLIGGPVPTSSPSKFSPECWETEAQAANRKLKTDLHQLTDNGRSMHVRGRKCSILRNDDNEAKNSVEDDVSRCNSTSKDPSDFIGFRASNVRVTSCNDPSFLKDLGDAVVDMRSSMTFATPFDPYKNASGERRKDLLYENFSSVVPGYTGKRTFIS